MQHKNIFRGLLLLLVTTGISCNKDYLDRNPLTQYSSETFWKNEDDVKIGLAGVYATLTNDNEGFGSLIMYWESLSDNAFIGAVTGVWKAISEGQLEATSGGIVSAAYSINYRAIATCNFFLDNVTKVQMPAATLAQYQAEVRLLRAYYYFQLSEIFGGVILSLKSETVAEATSGVKRAKSSKADVVKVILEDLDFAIANLPNTTYTGRAVKGTAQGLKLKVLLYNNRPAEAAQVGSELIGDFTNLTNPARQPFNLYPDYRGLFYKPGQRDANNREIMLSARYQLPNKFHTLDYRIGWTQFIVVQPLKNLVDEYEMKDGLPITASPLYDPANPYENRDARLKNSIYVPGMPWKYNNSGIYDGTNAGIVTGFLPRKYVDESRAPAGYATQSDQDIVLLRFADVLLMYAEAQNDAVAPDATVYSAVNAVRARSGQPPLPAGLTQDQMRERIRHERRVELALEGTRYFDLKRWRIAETVLPQITNPGGVQRKFEPKHYLFPFPQSEIDMLKPVLVQNTGYN